MNVPVVVDNLNRYMESGLVAQRNIQEPKLNVNNAYVDISARCYTNRQNVFSHDTVASSQAGDITTISLVDGVDTGNSPFITKDRESANDLAESLITKSVNPTEKTEPFARLEFENKKGLGCTLNVKGNKDCTVIVISRNSKGEYYSEGVKFAYYNPYNEKTPIEEHVEFLEEGALVMAFTDGGLQSFFSEEVQKELAGGEERKNNFTREPIVDEVLRGNVENNESLRILKERMNPMISALNKVGAENVSINIGSEISILPDNLVADDRGYVIIRVK